MKDFKKIFNTLILFGFFNLVLCAIDFALIGGFWSQIGMAIMAGVLVASWAIAIYVFPFVTPGEGNYFHRLRSFKFLYADPDDDGYKRLSRATKVFTLILLISLFIGALITSIVFFLIDSETLAWHNIILFGFFAIQPIGFAIAIHNHLTAK